MQDILNVVVIPVAIMGAILYVFYLFFGRAPTARDDPEGLRSFATFDIPDGLIREKTNLRRHRPGEALDDADQEELAEALLDALNQALSRRAIPLGAPTRESYGYTAELRLHKTTFALRLGWIGATEDDEEPDTKRAKAPPPAPGGWLLSVDPTRRRFSDSPDLRRLLLELHESLKALGALHLRWHRRQDWLAGNATGNALPLDRSLA